MQPAFSRLRHAIRDGRGQAREHSHNFMSLRLKLITGIVCAIALVSLGRALMEVSSQTTRIARDLSVKGDSMVAMAADLAAGPLLYNDDAAIAKAMQSLMLDRDIAYLQVVDSAGATRCELGVRQDDLLTSSTQIVYRTFPIGWLHMGISPTRIVSTRNEYVVNSLFSFGVTLLILVVLVSVITHYLMAPMEALKATVARISHGDYTARSNIRTNDEIGVLARFIDSSIETIAQREERLRMSESKYRVLFKSLPVGVAFVDGEGRLAEMNATFLESMGSLAQTHAAIAQWTLVHPDSTPMQPQDEPSTVAMRENRILSRTVGIVDTGETRWVNVTAAPFRQQNYGAVLACTDITDRIVADRLLLGEKERLRITLESIGDGVIATNSQGIVTLMNDVAASFTGWPVSEAVGRPLSQVFSIFNEATGEPAINPVDKVLSTGSVVELANHTVLRSRNGAVRYIADSAAPILDSSRNILGVIMVVRDVSEQKQKEKAQIYQSYHDVLTGLYNRSFFDEELKRLDQGRQMPISIIMGDVNGLKLTNDVFGHDEGDNLLKRIAAMLSISCRADDIIARTGGDEFCILLPKTTAQGAEEICQRIYNACASQHTDDVAGALRLSISLGYATKESADRRLHSVLKTAEDSMYKRKLLESRGQHSSIVTTIRTTLNEKSHETEDHSYRLMNYARMVGMKAMLNSDQLSDLELLAVMHDIGKIAVDDAVLNKNGPLTDDEWDQIRKHPEMGYRIASASPELMTIANCILTHHERWDGKGYPQGLSGADIPLLSRILTIVDSYDAMTQNRVYRKALSRHAALSELRRYAGTQFDPELVDIFIQCIEEAS